jgi:hypothetical protein
MLMLCRTNASSKKWQRERCTFLIERISPWMSLGAVQFTPSRQRARERAFVRACTRSRRQGTLHGRRLAPPSRRARYDATAPRSAPARCPSRLEPLDRCLCPFHTNTKREIKRAVPVRARGPCKRRGIAVRARNLVRRRGYDIRSGPASR